MAQINWTLFTEGLQLVNNAIGPWRALARLEEVLQYGSMLKEQIGLAEARKADADQALENTKTELGKVEKDLIKKQEVLATLSEKETTETARLEKVWADQTAKFQAAHDAKILALKSEFTLAEQTHKAQMAAMETQKAELVNQIKELKGELESLKSRVRSLG